MSVPAVTEQWVASGVRTFCRGYAGVHHRCESLRAGKREAWMHSSTRDWWSSSTLYRSALVARSSRASSSRGSHAQRPPGGGVRPEHSSKTEVTKRTSQNVRTVATLEVFRVYGLY
jgi:hypothetical protein